MRIFQRKLWTQYDRFFKCKNDRFKCRNEFKISDILVLLDVDYAKYKMIAMAMEKKLAKIGVFGQNLQKIPTKKF